MAVELAPNSPPPRGFRFRPSKKQLINHFLKPKIIGDDPEVDRFVSTVDLSKCDPWDLPHILHMPREDKKWHFFCIREQLHGKGKQYKRKTKSGFWKSTCEEEEIIDNESKECIGKKRILVFHKGRYPGERTEWVIHEYALNNPLPSQKASFVICCLKKKAKKTRKAKKSKKAKKDVVVLESFEGEPSGYIASDLEIPVTPVAIMQEHGHTESNYGSLSPYLDEGEPSCNFTSNSISETTSTAISVVDDHAIHSILSTQPLYSPEGHKDMPTSYGFADSEESIEELLKCFVDPDENLSGKTLDGIFNEPNQRTSLEMPRFLDFPVSCDMDAEGVDGRVNVLGPLAPGDLLQ